MRARIAVAWAARKTTDYSIARIARAMNRDHTTIMHNLKRAEQLRATDPAFRILTDRLLAAATKGDAA